MPYEETHSCPYCGGIIRGLEKYFRGQMPGSFFEYECLVCHEVIDVEAVPVPEFVLTRQRVTAPATAQARETEGGEG